MKNIEVEVRTLISSSEYKNLAKKLRKIAKFKGKVKEETVYFGSERLRVRKNDKASYLILKSGKIHQDWRREIEIKFKKEDFEKMKDILKAIGFPIKAVWRRKRKIFSWNGIKVFLDDTKGYGKIIELEKIVEKEDEEKTSSELKEKLLSLGIKKITSRAVFNKKFKKYLKNWKKLI